MKYTYLPAFNLEIGELSINEKEEVCWEPLIGWQIQEDDDLEGEVVVMPVTVEGIRRHIDDFGIRLMGRESITIPFIGWYPDEKSFIEGVKNVREQMKIIRQGKKTP